MNLCIHLTQEVSDFHICSKMRCVLKNEWLLFSPLAAVCTCVFTCAQLVSHLLKILTQGPGLRMVALLSPLFAV